MHRWLPLIAEAVGGQVLAVTKRLGGLLLGRNWRKVALPLPPFQHRPGSHPGGKDGLRRPTVMLSQFFAKRFADISWQDNR